MLKKLRFKDFRFGGLFFVLIAFVFVFCNSTDAVDDEGNKEAVNLHSALQQDTIPDSLLVSKTYKIIGVGDMMLGTNYPSASYLPPNGGNGMLAEVNEILAAADVTFGNLEGTLLDKGGTPKRCNNPKACYVFRSPETYIEHFKKAGFDLLSIANNHSGDFGPTGRTKTKALLKEAGIAYAGLAGTDEYAIFEKDSIKYGFCAFAPNRGTVDVRNIQRAKQIVSSLEEQSDIVIVSFHGGAEGVKNQNVPRKIEYYYGENRGDVHQFAHAVIDAGADVVFGHGPHVTRAMELYKERFIIYSLGNFCTYGRFSLSGAAGFAPLLEVEVNAEGAFVAAKVTPVYQQKSHGPKIDAQKRAISKLQQLTKTDFPETQLVIEDDGRVLRK